MKIIKAYEEEITDGTNGCCLACEEFVFGGIEPDAENYICDNCHQPQVFGLEQLLIMGKLELMPEGEENVI